MTVITGTGRSGTTFLIQLLTNLGFNTGWTREEAAEEVIKIGGVRGGIEHSLAGERIKTAEYVKNPEFLFDFEVYGAYKIDRVIIPIRDINSVADSRAFQDKSAHGKYGGFTNGATNKKQQKRIYMKGLYNLILHLTSKDIEIIFLNFNRMMTDPEYLYTRLSISVDHAVFIEEYEKLVTPEFIRF